MGTFGEGRLFRSGVQGRQEYLEDDYRPRDFTGYRDRALVGWAGTGWRSGSLTGWYAFSLCVADGVCSDLSVLLRCHDWPCSRQWAACDLAWNDGSRAESLA